MFWLDSFLSKILLTLLTASLTPTCLFSFLWLLLLFLGEVLDGMRGVCVCVFTVICSPLSPITSATWEYKCMSSLVASPFTTGDRKPVFLPVVPVEKGWRPYNLISLFSKKDVPVTQHSPFIHCHFSNQGSRGSFPSSKKSKGSHLPCSGSAGMR